MQISIGRVSATGQGRRRRRLAAAVALLAGLLAGPLAVTGGAAAQASATPATPAADGQGVQLALGDSIAFGFRPFSVTPPEQYADARNFRSYANLTARATGLRLVNASCPGETTASMMSRTAPDAGCRLYRSIAPLHTSYAGTQLDFAVSFLRSHPGTRLVTINVGANDIFLCQAIPGCDLRAAVAQAGANLARVLQRIRTQGGYRGTIVTLTYYFTPEYPASVVAPLNAALAAATRTARGRVADGLAAFQAATRRLGGDPCETRLLIKLPTGNCDRHPTSAGHLVLAVPVTLAYLKASRSGASSVRGAGEAAGRRLVGAR